MDLMTVKAQVIDLLTNKPETRDNDDLLYLEMLLKIENAAYYSVNWFLTHRTEIGAPTFETVRRARQKAQAENPELLGTRTEGRRRAEKEYYEFALTGQKHRNSDITAQNAEI